MRSESLKAITDIEIRYDAAIHAAVQDAGKAITFNDKQNYESTYASLKKVRANKEAGIHAFYQTLFLNFGIINDPIAQRHLLNYIPVVAVIDYDGYYILAEEEYVGPDHEIRSDPVWQPKKPYAYSDSAGNSLSFSLDDYVIAYERASNKWVEGKRSEVSTLVSIPLLNDSVVFEQVRRTTIVNAIQHDLEFFINKHNEVATKYGISYTFTLPTISQEEWNNTINDVGIMAFIQGLPIGDLRYNNYALGGGKVVKKPVIHGMIINGVKYYFRETCNETYTILETFSSEKEAASNGYFPLKCDG